MTVVYKSGELTTLQLANELSMKAQSIRKRYSETGSYFNIRPVKLPNGRLRWPRDAVSTLLNKGKINNRSADESHVELETHNTILNGGK